MHKTYQKKSTLNMINENQVICYQIFPFQYERHLVIFTSIFSSQKLELFLSFGMNSYIDLQPGLEQLATSRTNWSCVKD